MMKLVRLLAVVALSVASCAAQSVSGSSIFLEAPAYFSGYAATAMAVADLNGDGKPDLLVVTSGAVGVLLGNGDGTFQPAVSYNVGGVAAAIAVADVNGDGHPDLLVVTSGAVGVLLGNGDGTFQAAVSYGAGGVAAAIAVADVNGDGHPDLLVANGCVNSNNCSDFASGAVGVLLGNGDGTFQAAVAYNFGGSVPRSIVVADINGDGHSDLLVDSEFSSNHENGAVSVLLGNGDGTFQTAFSYNSGGAFLYSMTLADVNSDGKLDIVLANLCTSVGITNNCVGNGVVGVLLGNGDGTFQMAASYYSGGQGAGSAAENSIVVADVNGDGHPDLLVVNQCVSGSSPCSNQTPGVIGVLLGNGDGTFQAAVSYNSGGDFSTSIAVADVNGDGHPDVLVGSECSSSCTGGGVSVLLGNGDGTFKAAVSYNSGGQSAQSITVVDVNGDGHPDVLVNNPCAALSNCLKSNIGVLLGNSDGTFRAAANYSGGYDTVSIATTDVNGDGHPDLVEANVCISPSNCTNGLASVLLGNGDGTFRKAVSYSSGGYNAQSIAVADVNGDGRPDLLLANNCVSSSDCTNGVASVLLGNGDGTFQTAVSYNSGGTTESIAVADVNGDGKPDILVANECTSSDTTGDCLGNGAVGVLLGNGDGTFQAVVTYNSGGYYPFSIAVGDVNGDGRPDLIVGNECPSSGTNCSSSSLSVLLGNSDGAFQAPQTYNSGGFNPRSIAVADVNGDGYPDLLVYNDCAGSKANCSSAGLSVLLGNGNGTFQPAQTTAIPNEFVGTVAVADFNGDGKVDAAIGDVLLLGNGDGTFQTPLYSGATGQAAVGDFNGDGKPDLALGGIQGVTVLLNISKPEISTSTSLTASPNPATYGQTVSLSASVTSNGLGVPTGTIIFRDGTATLGAVPLSNGIASLNTSSLAVGNHHIVASYSGDSTFTASTTTLTLVVLQPVVSIIGAPQQPITKNLVGNYVAQVTVTNSGNVTINSVQVTIAGTTLGSGSLLAAPPPITNLAPGASAVMTLKFPPSSITSGSTSAPLKVSGTYSVSNPVLNGNWNLSFRSVSLQ